MERTSLAAQFIRAAADAEIARQSERDKLKAINAELLEALKEAARCLAWHEEKHGVGMDRKAVAQARAAIDKAEAA